MENSNVKENLEVLFEKFKNMIKVETVVGEAVQIGDTTLVPFVDVTFGFGTGTNHKANALSCLTLKVTLTAAASIVLSVWCLTSCPN